MSLAVARSLGAKESDAPRFNRDIRPILSDRCFPCHGHDAGNRKAELRLDTLEGATEWAVVPGDAENSEVILRVSSDDPEYRMPPANSHRPPLTPQQVELLRRWIDAGAEYQPHWSYIRPERPSPPDVNDDSRVRNSIDRFLGEKQQQHDIQPAAEADRVTLARRLYFDLIGLPPTPAEIDEFLQDDRPDAYERFVDKLLASPAYGERMAGWWFDLVRFADTVGYHGDQDHRIAPYRDYVIKSFNDNLPFDQFTIEQLAGDLLPNPTMWQLVATGYNRILQTTHEGGAQDGEYRAKHLADRVRNFSEVWLAASMGCAECHDHKFDPITQRDFYSLGAFFADVDRFGSFEKAASNSLPTERPPEMLAWTLPVYEKIQAIDEKIAELEAELGDNFRTDWEKKRDELISLKRERIELEAQFVPTMITEATTPRDVRILPRGNWMDQSGEVVQPQVPHFFEPLHVAASLRDADGSLTDTSHGSADSRRVENATFNASLGETRPRADRRPTRLDLAKWLVDGKNPLTARVVVNRLWHRYFGIGLSKRLLDLGSQGEWPQHADLLDWLAVEFVDSGWDVKHMVRIDGDLQRLSAVVAAAAGGRSDRPGQSAGGPPIAVSARCRANSRQRARRERPVGAEDRRRFHSPVSAGQGYYLPPQFPGARLLSVDRREPVPPRACTCTGSGSICTRGCWRSMRRRAKNARPNAVIPNTPSAALVLLNDPSFVEAARALAARVLTEAHGDDNRRITLGLAAWCWAATHAARKSICCANCWISIARTLQRMPQRPKRWLSVGISTRRRKLQLAELAAWTSSAGCF